MDLQSRKISFIQEYLRLTNVEIIEKLEKLLKQESKKTLKSTLKPMTHIELDKKIEEAEDDIKNGRVYTTAKAKTLVKKRFTQRNL